MAATRTIAVLEDPRFRAHEGPAGHPERPERLAAVAEALEGERASGELALDARPPRPAEDPELLRVHDAGHLARLAEAEQQAPVRLDADTFFSERSLEVARLAAGGVIDLARAVARGDHASGLAAVRPPGHHAEPSRAMGFCLLNNVALAARALQAEEGVGKVLVLDWDVHHGNGTQHAFEDDPSVLYFSTHQFPYYPGTGDVHEAGQGRGTGATVNVPLPAGCGDAEYVGVMQRVFAPVALAYAPDVILVSCGFDAHRDDPLASMEVSETGFHAMASVLRHVADEICGGRVAFILEGGYALSGLREGTRAVLRACRPTPPAAPGTVDAPAGSLLRQVVEQVRAVHGPRFRGLGGA